MKKIELGHTGIMIEKNGIGCLPVQRVTKEEAVKLLRKAYEGGVNFFDTARAYSDSEEKLGEAIKGIRENVYIATKTQAKTAEAFWKDLNTSLETLGVDYIDVFQFHNPPFCPLPGQENGLYDAIVEAKKQGKIKHIGITNHSLKVAQEAIDSGLYETLQFPFSYLSGEPEMTLIENCRKAGMGFIAMKGMAGGLIQDGRVASAFMDTMEGVVPIWGIQREHELDQFLEGIKQPYELTEEFQAIIEKDRKELAGEFCRGCGYCMPCPVGIPINACARMSLMIRRAPTASWLSEQWQEKMNLIDQCLHCNQCASKCPYHLDTPRLLQDNLKDYREVLAGKPL